MTGLIAATILWLLAGGQMVIAYHSREPFSIVSAVFLVGLALFVSLSIARRGAR